MSEVIVAATPLAGHTSPLIQLAAALVAAGHDVDFIGGERFTSQVKAAGARMWPLTGRAGYDDRRLGDFFPRRASLPPGPAQLSEDIAHVFGDAIGDQHALPQRILAEDPGRVRITDQLSLGAWPSALGVGPRPRRWIALGVIPLHVPGDDISMMGPVLVAPGQDQAGANPAATLAFEAAVSDGVAHMLATLTGLGTAVSRFDGYLKTAYALPDLVVQPTAPEFEFPRVTQGTVSNTDLSALVEPTLTALSGEDVVVVAALGGRTVRPPAAPRRRPRDQRWAWGCSGFPGGRYPGDHGGRHRGQARYRSPGRSAARCAQCSRTTPSVSGSAGYATPPTSTAA